LERKQVALTELQSTIDYVSYSKEIIWNSETKLRKFKNQRSYLKAKLQKITKLLCIPDSLYVDLYRIGKGISFQSTSNIVKLISKTFRIQGMTWEKTKIAELVHETADTNILSWKESLQNQSCFVSFDIASPYLQACAFVLVYSDKSEQGLTKESKIHLAHNWNFKQVSAFQNTRIVKHFSPLIEINNKKATTVHDAIQNRLQKLKVSPLWFMTDGGSENTGRKTGAIRQLHKSGYSGHPLTCAAHNLHNTFQHACKQAFHHDACVVIDYIIRMIRNNWSTYRMMNIKWVKPKLVLQTR